VSPTSSLRSPNLPSALAEDEVLLDGRARAVDVGHGDGDVDGASVVHVPDLDLVVAGDLVYNGIHPWLAGSTASSRAAWLEALDRVERLGASTIVAGHKDAAAPDDDAHRCLDATREYLVAFDHAAAASDSLADLFAKLTATHPDLGNPYTLWVAVHDQPGG
jgi:glyoxylase-like metal-dependent hydrolase (beta-lactamase superfamily II)